MKKFISLLLIVCCISSVASALELSAVSAVLIDADSGRVLYSKNSNSVMTMASTTKIMTALIALTKGNLTDMVTVSSYAASQEGSSMYLAPGEKIVMKDLIYGLMLASGNDAAVAIAEHISGSVSEFASLMTDTAKNMGCVNTGFKNPNGLDEQGHHTTAYELALITNHALKNSVFAEVVATKSYKTSSGKVFTNHNKLLNMYEGCTGVKTGFTKKSGRTLVSSASRNGLNLIAVTLNAPNDWNDHIKMFDLGFSQYQHTNIIEKDSVFGNISVSGGVKPFVSAVYDTDIYATLTQDEISRLEKSTICTDKLEAPVKIGQKAGETVVSLDGVVLGKASIITQSHSPVYPKKTVVKSFKRVILEWLLMIRQNKMVI